MTNNPEAMAIELQADLLIKTGHSITLEEASAIIRIGYIATSYVLESNGALSERAKLLRKQVTA